MKKLIGGLLAAVVVAASLAVQAQTLVNDTHKSALILIEYQNDWMASTGGINSQFKDRKQFDDSVKNSKLVLAEARRRHMEIIYVTMTLEPSFKVLGEAKYGLRAMMPQYKSFLGKQAEFFPGFEPAAGEYVIRERTGSSAFAGTSLDSYLRNNHIEDIYLMGYSLRQCVESTLRNAHDLGYNTNVIYDASAGFSEEQQSSFLTDILPFYGNGLTAMDFIKSGS